LIAQAWSASLFANNHLCARSECWLEGYSGKRRFNKALLLFFDAALDAFVALRPGLR